jgi:hypothetical protein
MDKLIDPAATIVDANSVRFVLVLSTISPLEGDENFISVISGAWGHERIRCLRLIESWKLYISES